MLLLWREHWTAGRRVPDDAIDPDSSRDFHEVEAIVASYKTALGKAAPPKIVFLSSMGSEKPSGLGLTTSPHLLEEGVGGFPFPVAFIRAGSFYENYLFGLQAGQGGTLPIFYAPTDRKLSMIATEDIGAEVAKLLTTEWTGKRIIELGSLISSDELASELCEVLGREVKAQAIRVRPGLARCNTWACHQMARGLMRR